MQRQGTQLHLTCAPSIQRRLVSQHLALHHPNVRTAQNEHQVGVLQALIPDLLQHRWDAGIAAGQIGELVDDDNMPLVGCQFGQCMKRAFPAIVDETG